MTNLPILSVETSGEICSTAVMVDEKTQYEFTIKKKHVHSQMLMTMINDVLNHSGIKPDECAAIAVSDGPGSFTGLRIGMSAAKGLAMGAGLPIVQVPTMYALALQISGYLTEGDEFAIVNNANISELYYARFVKLENNYDIIDDVRLITKEAYGMKNLFGVRLFGDFAEGENKAASPGAVSVARWAYLFGKDLLNYKYEYIEPNYLKKFVAKVKK